jgi:hypothetical protein
MIACITWYETLDSSLDHAVGASGNLGPHSKVRYDRGADHKEINQTCHEHQGNANKPSP